MYRVRHRSSLGSMAVTENQSSLISQNPFPLAQFWLMLQRRWRWGAVTFGTVLTAVTLLSNGQQPPIYPAQANLHASAISPISPELSSAQWVSEPQVSPKILFNLILGSLLGAVSAITVMWILEIQDGSLKTTAEAQTALGGNLLAVIPDVGGLSPTATPAALIVKTHPDSAASHAYRGLQTRLNGLDADGSVCEPVRQIAITSSIPQEGKSTTVANLALTLTELGQRVLLIDADLRLPSQHEIWGVSNRCGLSNVIAVGLHPQQVIRPVAQNLDLLTAGVSMSNPLVLIDSRRMATLLEHFSNTYDYVLMDTPPVTVAADALVLGKMVDGLLMVVRPGLVETSMVQTAHNLLHHSGQTVLGMVVNGAGDTKLGAKYSSYSLARSNGSPSHS
jgi:polysaccharide biosynthesis transport protein